MGVVGSVPAPAFSTSDLAATAADDWIANAGSLRNQAENGGTGMPAFKGQLTGKQIADVAAYVTQKTTK